MYTTFKSLIATLVLSATTALATNAGATTMTVYTNRDAFVAALDSHTVDNLDGIGQYHEFGLQSRPDYTYSTPMMYGCINNAGCYASNQDDAFLWNYVGKDTFTSAFAVNGFGFDFNDPYRSGSAKAIIDDVTSVGTSGFFGIVYSDARTTFTVNQIGSYMVMDKITFGTTALPPASADVPEPAAPALLGLAFAGMLLARRLRK